MSKIPFSAYDFFGYLASGAVVLAAVDVVAQTGLLSRDWGAADSIMAIVAVYVAGHAVAHVASVTLEHGLLRRWLGSSEGFLLGEKPPTVRSKIFPGHYSALPAATMERIDSERGRRGGPDEHRAFFHHAHALVKERPIVQERLAIFLNLYGFARNMALALFLAGSLVAVQSVTGCDGGPASSSVGPSRCSTAT